MRISGLKFQEKLLWAGAFLVFFSGFFIFHGREAATSGSWRYVMTHGDEYGYWAIAKGASEIPKSDANPFYYEERGASNPIPYTGSELTGLFTRFFKVPLMALFPVWHIGMPFLLWASLFVCLKKLWGYPPLPSGVFSLLVLLSLLYLRGQAPHLIYRYSRPGDGGWLLVILVSLLMNLDGKTRWKALLAGILGAAVLWLQAYYILLPLLVLMGEGAWQLFFKKKKGIAAGLAGAGLLIGVSGLLHLLYIKIHLRQNPWLVKFLASSVSPHPPGLDAPSLFLYSALAFLVFFLKIHLRRPLSRLDRLVLFVFLIEPLTMHLQILLPSTYHFSTHRYYFLVIEIAVLTGWLKEKWPLLLTNPNFRRWEWPAAAGFTAFALFLSFHPGFHFLRGNLSAQESSYFDNSLLLLGIFSVLYPATWAWERFEKIRINLRRPAFVVFVIAVLTLAGYSLLPSELRENNRAFPFDKAYRWLQKNTRPGEVLLTAMPSRFWMEDYALLYTDLKVYCSPHYGRLLSKDQASEDFREKFYAALLLGNLKEVSLGGQQTVEGKLKFLRLDYILINLPSPFAERIAGQLNGFLEEVYKDEKSLVWRVKLPTV